MFDVKCFLLVNVSHHEQCGELYLQTGLQGTHQQDGLVGQPEAAHTGLQLQL